MNSKLPNVFHNNKSNLGDNNKEVFYSKIEEEKRGVDINDNIKPIIIRKKINDIFNSKNFVYKANVIITTKDGDREVTLIHKNNDHLLTINNESIPIDSVIDIKRV